MDWTGTPLELEDKVNCIQIALYSTERRTRQYVKGYGLWSFARNLSDKYRNKILGTATKTWLDTLKIASKNSP